MAKNDTPAEQVENGEPLIRTIAMPADANPAGDIFGGWLMAQMDLAASIQAVTEEVMLLTARHLHETTRQRYLCLAGGVALNCVANGRIQREGPFDDVWIQPAAGDAGGALGCALFAWHQLLESPRRGTGKDAQRGSLLGPRYEMGAITATLDGRGAKYAVLSDEARLLEHPEVLHDAEARHRQPRLQRAQRLPVRLEQLVEQPAPRRIGQRPEHIIVHGSDNR